MTAAKKSVKNNAKIKTAFTEQFDVDLPIICAPMFLVSSVKMVVAASQAGGVGTFPALNYRPISRYNQAIEEIQQHTDKAFGINIIVQQSNKHQHEQIDQALERKVPLIISSLGNPKQLIHKAHSAGTKVYCDVVGMEHAKKVVDTGADGLIAVASGAGGHAGTISSFALIRKLAKEFPSTPIVAAGSIVDGAGMAAAFALGASAVYLGTRFIATKEAEVQEDYKQTIIKAQSEDIINTDKVDGFPGNFILNEALAKLGLETGFVEHMLSKSDRLKKWIALGRAAKSLFGSENSKASYKTVYSAGHGVGLINDVPSIAEVMQRMKTEYLQARDDLPS